MAQFVLIPTQGDTTQLDAAVRKTFENKCFQLPKGEWLVVYSGTSKQLSDDLHISDGTIGAAVVVLGFNGYFGRANPDVWEWISLNAKN